MAGHSSSCEQKPASVKGGGQAALETAAPRLGVLSGDVGDGRHALGGP
jgi:hypothetical protein